MQLLLKNERFWLASSLVGLLILYLNLIWKSTENIDEVTTNLLYFGAIFWLLWQKRDRLLFNSDILSSLLGLLIIFIVLIKTISLFDFEKNAIAFIPFCLGFGLAAIASGIKRISQYTKELFFALFLFFPTDVLGFFLNKVLSITSLNAKVTTYIFYYLGFNVASQKNEILLSLPNLGQFKSIVNYSCSGIAMILLMLKISLLLIFLFPLKIKDRIIIPLFSVIMGFFLGVIRVAVMTLLISDTAKFDYWHGSGGSQIFSTIAMIIFSIFCYGILERRGTLNIKH